MESACLFHKDMMKAFAKHDIRHKVFPNHNCDGSRNYIFKVKFPSTGVIPIPPIYPFSTKKYKSHAICVKLSENFGLHIPRITSALLVGISGNCEKSQPGVRKQN